LDMEIPDKEQDKMFLLIQAPYLGRLQLLIPSKNEFMYELR